ncbi:protein mono-ADP-ribosyltransferase PARP14-like isoform X2 [Corticium candelabrum]|nr:protein mono-ADP-ribosyltransferase PARP14-like isoform X2 [Corticium candelabrum]
MFETDRLVASCIWKKIRPELYSSAKKVNVRVEKEKDDPIAMIGTQNGVSTVLQWLSTKALELTRSFTTEMVHFDSVEAVALQNFAVGSSIRRLEIKNCVEIKWPEKGLVAKRPITNAGQERVLELRIKNLLDTEVDAIICAANSSLDTTTGLAKILSNAGGISIQSQLNDYVKLHGMAEEGSSVAIEAGELRCEWLVFAVVPGCAASTFNSRDRELFRAAVSSSLRKAGTRNATTVAIPALKAGSSQLPIKNCAEVTIQASRQYLESCSDSSVSKIEIVLPPDPKLVEEFENKFSADVSTIVKLPDLQPPVASFLWLYEDDSGSFNNYDVAAAKAIEEQFQASVQTATIQIKMFTYKVDFSSMIQTNLITFKSRRIKRIVATVRCAWFYRGNDGCYERYDKISSSAIETAHAEGQSRIYITPNKYTYTVDLKKMEQTNNSTKMKRSIKRQVASTNTTCSFPKLAMSFEDVDVHIRGQPTDVEAGVAELTALIRETIKTKEVPIPNTLSTSIQTIIKQYGEAYGLRIQFSQSPDSGPSVATVGGFKNRVDNFVQDLQEKIIQLQQSSKQPEWEPPPEWELPVDPNQPILKFVNPAAGEYKRVLNRMRESMPEVQIVKLERIQNVWLWRKYCQHMERMREKNEGSVKEKELFHGTSSTNPEKIYLSEEGFDMRFCAGRWGWGCYFAENASYSDGFCYRSLVGMQMFLAKVLTGESISLRGDKSLRMPPEKKSSSGHTVRFDTVTGVSSSSRIYVTYNNDKAFPFYLITYR